MESELKEVNENLVKLRKDIELIKNILIAEGELSDWAKKELSDARKTPRSHNITHEEVKKRILAR